MMLENSLSIVIPVLNEESYIGNILDDLDKQSFKDFEVIVVDGGSQDKTLEIIRKHSLEVSIQKIKSPSVSNQRNLGYSAAKGDIILFLDADVSLGNEFLERCLSEIERKRICIASCPMKPDLDDWYYRFFCTGINVTMRFTQYLSLAGFGACLFISREILEKIGGFDVNMHFAEDHDLISRAGRYRRIKMLRPSFITSMRRFEERGTKRTMMSWGKGLWYFLFNKDRLRGFDY